MGLERTLAILKPDCVRKNLQGEVISRIQKAGFRIIGIRQIRLTNETAGGFYAVHKERPFYKDLVAFMTSGPCWPMALEKENAIADFRKLIGATDPKEAEEGTVRKLFADGKEQNIVHGSDAVDTAKDEIAFFFPKSELL